MKEKTDDTARTSSRSDGNQIFAYMYDPNKKSWCQRLMRFINSLVLVLTLLMLTLFLQNQHLLLLIDGAVLSNILMLLLPNALYLYQINYGYLKYQESHWNYLGACALFYLSLFNIIYTLFRGMQIAMGELNVRKIV